MTLYIIGIGLNDEKDISVKGLEIVKSADVLYLESYTSKLSVDVSSLEEFYGKKIIIADRDLVEKKAEETIIKDAKSKEVCFLVVGDSLSATTHVDLLMRAKKEGIPVKIIHNASALTAVGITGLELYKFGKVTSIPFENENVTSPVKVFEDNQKMGLHTLFLLDLDPINDKFMTISEAGEYLIKKGVSSDLNVIACASLGSDSPFIKYGKLKDFVDLEIDRFPQCLIIPGKLHFMEEEVVEQYK